MLIEPSFAPVAASRIAKFFNRRQSPTCILLYLQGWSARSSSTTSANMDPGNIFQGNPPWSSYRLPGASGGRRRRLAVYHAEQDI
jgi:hypothetical protein